MTNIRKLSLLTRRLLFQKKPLKPPLTAIWWRRYSLTNNDQ
ncbi:MAG: hypothetical protein V7L00_17840 [Nostoc sp.]